MNVQGIEKLSLLDYPGKLGCTVFVGGCNMRCPFCHNSEIAFANPKMGPGMAWDQVLGLLRKRLHLLDGVCITGGEPTLQSDLADGIAQIKALGLAVKLDTNGAQPHVVKQLVQEGLVDYIAMDIKNTPEKYSATVGITNFNLTGVQETIDFLLTGRVEYEFRTTVIQEFHALEDFPAIARWLQGAEKYFLQKFVAGDHVPQQNLHAYTDTEMKQIKGLVLSVIPGVELRGL